MKRGGYITREGKQREIGIGWAICVVCRRDTQPNRAIALE